MQVVFFKREKPKQFELKTRFYDPDEEARERRKRKMEQKKKEGEFNPDDMRAEMQYRWGLNRESNSSFNTKYTNSKRMLVLLLIALILMGGMYLLGVYYVG